MSWTRVQNPYADFLNAARSTPPESFGQQWQLSLWEVTTEYPHGRWEGNVSNARHLQRPAKLRIVFAPLDLPQSSTALHFLELFRILSVPQDFVNERLQSVSHSFGTRTDSSGSCSWFHFLCKYIEIRQNEGDAWEVHNRRARLMLQQSLPHADYSYHRSGFFLRFAPGDSVTLVCFGATPRVTDRLHAFINGGRWEDALAEPHVLFDIVLDGLFLEVDATVWNMNQVFGGMEHKILTYANEKTPRKLRMSQIADFSGLHNCAKHVIHIAEAVQSSLLAVEGTLALANEPTATNSDELHLRKDLTHRLQYRRSLFESTRLRLGSLQKRVENAITLSFNLVSQQDSLILLQDSSSMKTIALITMIFLPTTGVATVLGGALFNSNQEHGRWEVKSSPLFLTLWYISIPLTAVTLALAYFFHRWSHREGRPRRLVVEVLKRPTSFRRNEAASDSRIELARTRVSSGSDWAGVGHS